jgi:hypothetical protein
MGKCENMQMKQWEDEELANDTMEQWANEAMRAYCPCGIGCADWEI